ncbi:mandelate racemase/muconate lactonizing enzyme family protein [Ruegeria lacuscaerulensis]|uniref:mandelate racemase/muconate lactonizing enzyme family protein n=1 Tax=Ruegeria lacuscaerulensis TaxID=55218 RepID=UPI001481BB74|nr:mandelate racemase/muconate lactonizing enzyme family protein [Ruegeria lacuscaerulensis]
MNDRLRIARIQGFAFRSPIADPVLTSFGIMKDRPAVFVRIEDRDGCFGWGEIFANWPAAAAEHRVNLLVRDVAPFAFEHAFSHPEQMFELLTSRTEIVALQSGEWGPFRQVIAGLDIALWDLFARRNGQTLRHYMNAESPDVVPAYASGIHITDAEALIPKSREFGFSAFKVKVGFNMEDDLALLEQAFDTKAAADTIAADANQGWTEDAALSFITSTRGLPLEWLEEPIRADADPTAWAALSRASPYPLAGGENLVGFDEFDSAVQRAHLRIFQPDIIKWGGITGCLRVGQNVQAAGLRYCPHFLGGGIGLQASANLLAAVGGDGLLEIDANPNPLRDAFGSIKTCILDHGWRCNSEPGIGIVSVPEELTKYETHKAEVLSPMHL